MPIAIDRIGPGEVFGWSAAHAGDSFTLAAVATVDTEMMRFPHDGWVALCESDPELGRTLDMSVGIAHGNDGVFEELLASMGKEGTRADHLSEALEGRTALLVVDDFVDEGQGAELRRLVQEKISREGAAWLLLYPSEPDPSLRVCVFCGWNRKRLESASDPPADQECCPDRGCYTKEGDISTEQRDREQNSIESKLGSGDQERHRGGRRRSLGYKGSIKRHDTAGANWEWKPDQHAATGLAERPPSTQPAYGRRGKESREEPGKQVRQEQSGSALRGQNEESVQKEGWAMSTRDPG